MTQTHQRQLLKGYLSASGTGLGLGSYAQSAASHAEVLLKEHIKGARPEGMYDR